MKQTGATDFNSSFTGDSELSLLKQNYKRIYDSWFPANPLIFQRLKTRLSSETSADPSYVVIDLKSDFALFSYCLKQLAQVVKTEKREFLNPAEIFTDDFTGKINSILNLHESSVSTHSLESASTLQSSCHSRALVSATACELLAEAYEIDKDTAFTTAMLRQLGRTLIAWNYPRIFEKAMASSNGNPDLHLNRILGFSPTLLGIRIARQWQLVPEVLASMGDLHAARLCERREHGSVSVATLAKICEIGEMFAEAAISVNDNGTSSEQWEKAQSVIRHEIGESSFTKLQERLSTSLSDYDLISPVFSGTNHPLTAANKAVRQETLPDSSRRFANSYINRLNSPLKEMLSELYDSIDFETASKANVDRIVKVIIPAAGFSEGCIYLFDPESRSLFPRLTVGNSTKDDFTPVNNIFLNDNIVARAYRSVVPVTSLRTRSDGSAICEISGLLGVNEKAGVLRLIANLPPSSHKESVFILPFKAIRQALADSLTLF